MQSPTGTVSHTATIEADPERTWLVVRAFGRVSDWHPIAKASRIVAGVDSQPGAERELTLGDGRSVRERLVSIDDDARELVYCLLTFPIPVVAQENKISIATVDTRLSLVTFSAKFAPSPGHSVEEVETMNTLAFTMAASGLRQLLLG